MFYLWFHAWFKGDAAVVHCDSPSEETGTKRQVRMNSEVHVVYGDGDTTVETLAEDKFTAGAKKVEKPIGHKVEVVDATSAATSADAQCKQQ